MTSLKVQGLQYNCTLFVEEKCEARLIFIFPCNLTLFWMLDNCGGFFPLNLGFFPPEFI